MIEESAANSSQIDKRKNVAYEEQEKYLTLSPIKEANISGYEEALNFVFSNDNIKNAAVSGVYCSGKSSIIESYEVKNKENLKFLHISLAHFCAINKINEDGKINRATIESKILNQLIQQIPRNKLLLSKFQIKENSGKEKTVLVSVMLCVFIAMFLHCWKFFSWKYFYEYELKNEFVKLMLEFTTKPESRLISAAGLLIICGLIIYKLIYAQYTYSFIRKISFQGNEIEIGNESSDSFFDKYLNEVLYIFEEADADAIVFEDIDRFDDVALFERLREINTLVNIRKRQKNIKPLRFIYVMRDDVFGDFKERTKFFDFIIPVIPIVDGSNSYGFLVLQLKKAGLNTFNDHFLRAISIYIDDCRILKNIINELLLYHEILKKSELNLDKLLAVITYKNVFPHDFDEMRFRRGYMYSFFAAESQIKLTIKSSMLNEEKIIKGDIEQAAREYNESRENLNRKNSIASVKPEEQEYTLKCAKNNEIYKEEKEIVDKFDRNIIDSNEKYRNYLRRQTDIDNMTFSELLSKYSDLIFAPDYLINTIKIPDEIVNNSYFGLIKFLLTNGHINLSYSDYMNYYYENGLSVNDNHYIRSVLECNRLDYGHKIDSPSLVIKSLNPNCFSQPATLNYALYDFIFSDINLNDYSAQIKQIKSFFESSRRSEYVDFIDGYLINGKAVDMFVKYLFNSWYRVFDYVSDKISSESLKKLSYLIIKNGDAELIEGLGGLGTKLTEYISTMPAIIESDIDKEKLIMSLLSLDVKFKNLDNKSINSEALKLIYANKLYEPNESNIQYLRENNFISEGNENS